MVESNEREVKGKPVVLCPFQAFTYCADAEGDPSYGTCAWWIPGAECCALVQIARKLNDLAALDGEGWTRINRG